MKAHRTVLIGGLLGAVAALASLGWVLLVARPARNPAAAAQPASTTLSTALPATGRKIKARLYYVAEDGAHLMAVERDVPYSDGTVGQARQIIEAQLASVPEPLLSAVPPGTAIRALFLTDRGEAYVDLSREIMTAQPGGSTNELLTVYTLVNALTTNLPAVSAVQLLVDGKPIDTLAGHVDLRRPLTKNLAWVE